MKGKRRPIPFVEDTIVPPENLAAYIKGFRKILEKYKVVYGMFGHVDAGCLHVRPALNMRQFSDRTLIRQITDEVANLLKEHDGIFSSSFPLVVISSIFGNFPSETAILFGLSWL